MAYHMLRFLLKLISFIPFGLLYLISDCLFVFVYYLGRYRRRVVRRNLELSFPEKTSAEIAAIERKFYRFFVDNVLETCKMANMSADAMRRRMRFVNVEEVNAHLREGRSVSLFLGHLGNWEWVSSMPLWLESSATPAQIYHPLSNKAVDRVMLEARACHGAVNVEMRRTAHFIINQIAARKVSIIGFIADQSPRRSEANNFLPFMGQSVPVITGTEKITKKFGFEAYFTDVRRVRRGYYEAEFVRLAEHPSELPDFELTALYYRRLEAAIRRAPQLYLWSHKRFKFARVQNPQP